MTARLLWFVVLLVTIATYTMAFQCYQSENVTTTEITCQSGWCLTAIALSGEAFYDCDANAACADIGNECVDNKVVHDQGLKSICCCNSDLCNNGTTAFQCYQGPNGSTTEVTCQSGWCLTGMLISGEVHYDCDSNDACASVGNGCYNNQSVLDNGYKSICCCNSDLCNKGSIAFQCYSGVNESTTEVSCQSSWCATVITLSGEVHYACDSGSDCASVGNGCHSDQTILDAGFKSVCCCNMNLCNEGLFLALFGIPQLQFVKEATQTPPPGSLCQDIQQFNFGP
uniref:Uncharacterized protein n=1 Tax=Plectus sambesii TaxID=2011161 RepID=A0A914W3U0_9BILA